MLYLRRIKAIWNGKSGSISLNGVLNDSSNTKKKSAENFILEALSEKEKSQLKQKAIAAEKEKEMYIIVSI